jgi:hypothetical protein
MFTVTSVGSVWAAAVIQTTTRKQSSLAMRVIIRRASRSLIVSRSELTAAAQPLTKVRA